jgi:hypothetical protein
MVKKIIFFLFFFGSFIAVFLHFGGYIKKLVYLKNNGEVINAKIINVKSSGYPEDSGLELHLSFELDSKEYRDKINVGTSSIAGIFLFRSSMSDYQLGKRIKLLANRDKWFIRPADTIKTEIIDNILFLIIIPLFISVVAIILINCFENPFKKVAQRYGKKSKLYEYYFQDRNYKITIKNSEENIRKKYVQELIDINKLQNGEIMCYGVSRGECFVELFYTHNEYFMRISCGEDKEEEIENDGEIIDKYYNLVKYNLGR